MMKRWLAVLLSGLVVTPGIAAAQASKAGVVTTLEGNVTARRVALPSPVPLKFKDDVFLQDTLTTGDKSLARMLLGGKAVVTVRERSVLTITEVPGRSTIELESGKFALAVAREKMRPGEEIQIRTPNAIAGVRGTVVITEVNRQSAQAGGPAPAVLTNFYVLRGSITAQPLDPGTRQPTGTPLNVGSLQAYSGAGTSAPRVAPVPPEQVSQITSGLQPSGPKGGGDAGKEQVKSQQVQTAAALLTTLTGGPDAQASFVTAPPKAPAPPPAPNASAPPIVAVKDQIAKAEELATLTLKQLSDLISEFLGVQLTLTNKAGKSFTSSFTSSSTAALLSLSGATIVLVGEDLNFVEVLSGGDVTLAGPLATITNSTLTGAEHLFEIDGGKFKSTTSSALIAIDPSTVSSSSALINLSSGALSLAGPLLTDVNGTLVSSNGDFVRLTNSTLSGTGTDALVQLTGTAVSGRSALNMFGSTMQLAGPLVTAANVTGAGVSGGDNAPLFTLNSSKISSSSASPLITFTSTNADPDFHFLRLTVDSTIALAGPLFSATGSTLKSGRSNSLASFFGVFDGSAISSDSSSPLVSLTSSTVDSQGPFFSIRRSASANARSRVTLAGPLFSGTNVGINTTSTAFASTFGTTAQNCCSVFSIQQGASLTSTGTAALISLSGSTVTVADAQSGGSFFHVTDTVGGLPSGELIASSTVALAGPLLSASSSTITPLFALVNVRRSAFTSASADELVKLTSHSTVNAGGTDINGVPTFGRMLLVISDENPFGNASIPASMNLAGPFLGALDSSLSGSQVMAVLGGATFTSTTSKSLIALENSVLKLTSTTAGSLHTHGDVLFVGGQGANGGTSFATATLSGPLLKVSGTSSLDTSGALAHVFAGGKIVESHASDPFVAIIGGSHKIAQDSGNALLRLFGRTGATASENIDTTPLSPSMSSDLTLGTDQPLQRSGTGAYLEASSGASITTVKSGGGGYGVYLDTALLSASAPLLSLKTGAALTIAAEGINLASKAKLTAVGPLVSINGAALTIANNSAINVAGGSFLNISSGDLLSMIGGTLNISNGAILRVADSSVVKIHGGLVNFNNSAATVNLTNNLCAPSGCTIFNPGPNQLQVFFTNSGNSSNVSASSNTFKNAGSATVVKSNGGNTAHVIIDGANSKLIVSGN